MTALVNLMFSLLLFWISAAFCSAAPADCTPNTFSCGNNCTAVTFCTVDLDQIVVEQCVGDNRCDTATNTCTLDATCYPPPDLDNFKCHTTGSLPDPYDCHKYHFCYSNTTGNATNLVDLKFDCPGSTAYDPLTTMCEYTDADRVCVEGPIDECKAVRQEGPQKENPNIYYLCVLEADGSLVPWLFRCPAGEVFVTDQCVPKTESTMTEATTTPTTPTSTPATTPSTTLATTPTSMPATTPTTTPATSPTTTSTTPTSTPLDTSSPTPTTVPTTIPV